MNYPDNEPRFFTNFDAATPPVYHWRWFCERHRQFCFGVSFVPKTDFNDGAHIDFAFGPFVIGFEHVEVETR